jgi:hypothetical protein
MRTKRINTYISKDSLPVFVVIYCFYNKPNGIRIVQRILHSSPCRTIRDLVGCCTQRRDIEQLMSTFMVIRLKSKGKWFPDTGLQRLSKTAEAILNAVPGARDGTAIQEA